MDYAEFKRTPPVESDETLYRQIGPSGQPIYFDPKRHPPVHRSLFMPSRADTDGLSLIRSRFRTRVWAAYRVEKPLVRFRLAQLQTSRLRTLAEDVGFPKFHAESTPDELDQQYGPPWAHCVVKEINRRDYDNDWQSKRMIKEWAMAVAGEITSDFVLGPYPVPTSEDPLRPR